LLSLPHHPSLLSLSYSHSHSSYVKLRFIRVLPHPHHSEFTFHLAYNRNLTLCLVVSYFPLTFPSFLATSIIEASLL
jgi:hypothetical protein